MRKPYQILINFSQSVTNFTQSDIVITNAIITNFQNLSANKRFRITVEPITDGEITVVIPANSATNSSSLPNVVSNSYRKVYYSGHANWFFNFDGIVGGEIYDITHSSIDEKIYFGGGFLQVDGNSDMKNIARWNPRNNTWEQIPGIDYTHENFIRSMVQDDDGNLYVGGDFSTIANIPALRIAKFNVAEGTWESLRDVDFFVESQQRGPETGGVYAIAYHDSYVYIGGHVFNNPDPAYLYIRRYNILTKTWESVGAGVNAKVSALAVDDDGNIYAGGIFTDAGGVPVNNIAMWNGTSWSTLGEGTNGDVLDLKFYDGNLYVAGSFTKVGGNIRSQGIAKWDGTSWHPMGEGIERAGATPSVYGISISQNGKIFIGGYFDLRFSDDAKINHVAVFENDDWQPLGHGLGNSTTQGINAVYAYGNNIFFGGAFSKPIVGGLLNQAIWNETFDFTQDMPPAVSITTDEPSKTANTSFDVTFKFTEVVSGFQKSDITVINGGVINLTQQTDARFYIAEITPLVDGEVKIFILEDRVIGISGNPNSASDTLTITYSGVLADIDKNWFFDFDGLINGGVYDIAKSSIDNKIYFAGGFLNVGGNANMKNIVRYIPTTNTWEQVPGITSTHSNFIRCFAEDADGNLYVGGDFSSIGGVTVGRVAKFEVANGTWSALEDPTFFEVSQRKGPNSGGVYAITVSGDYVYIGGHTFNSSNAAYLYIRRFNIVTSTWESVGSGVNAKVSALTTDDVGNVYAGGTFTTAGGEVANFIAKWDGTNWSAIGEGTNDEVLEILYSNENLYVAGRFTTVGDNIRSQGIAKYDGTSWQAMGKGVDNSRIAQSVYGIAVDTEDNIYIAGYFDIRYSDDERINHTAMFDGIDWISMGSGLGSSTTQGVNALFADGDNIYAGGAFTKPAGGTQNTAIWNKNIDFRPDLPPSVRIYTFENPITSSSPINVVVEFSEVITGFDIADLAISNGSATGYGVILENLKFMVQVVPTQVGVVTFNYSAGNVTDLNGNANTAALELSITYQPIVISLAVNFENSGIVTGEGNYGYGDLVSLVATANEGYVFVNWTEDGTEVSTESTYTFVAEVSRSLVANFDVASYTISATVNPEESGILEGSGAYNHGDLVALIATANTGFTFVNWTEGETEVSTNATYSFAAISDRTFVANFEVSNYNISATINPENAGTIIGEGTYAYGDPVTLTATANTGYTFVNWTESEAVVSTNATFAFTAESDRVLLANFSLITYTITAAVFPENAGTIQGAGDYNHGYEVTLIASANNGYTFVNWTKDEVEVFDNLTYTFTADSDKDLVANFTINSYTISASVYPENSGNVDGAGDYNHGDEVTLTATANTSFTFVNWTEGGVEVSTNATYSFTAISDRTLVANFEVSSYNVSATVNPENAGSINGEGTFVHGDPVTLTATANTGYTFVNWTESEAVVSTNSTFAFTAESDRVLVANFTLNSYTITLTSNPANGGTVSGAGTFNHGEEVILTATANTGFTFVNWTNEDANLVSELAEYEITVIEDLTLSANFQLINSAEISSENGLMIYPNPARDFIYLNGLFLIKQISIIDMTGQVVYSDNNSSKDYTLDISTLAQGLYLLKILSSEGVIHHRRIVISR
jgi:hypothetical protein